MASIRSDAERLIGAPRERRRQYDLYHCPLGTHVDKTPSFAVYDDHFYCYGCKQSGNHASLLMRLEKLSLKEALEKAGKIQAAPVPERKKPPIEINEIKQMQNRYENIKDDVNARGINDSTAKFYSIGCGGVFTFYQMSSTELIKFRADRISIPDILGDEVRTVNFRLHKKRFLEAFFKHPDKDSVLKDIEQKLKREPTEADIITMCGFPKYKQDWRGKQDRVFNAQALVKRNENRSWERIKKPYVLIHPETKELDTILLSQLGYNCVGVNTKQSMLPHLKAIFQMIEIIYIVQDNDSAGRANALRVQNALGRGIIVLPPRGFKDCGEAFSSGVDLTDFFFAKYGIEVSV